MNMKKLAPPSNQYALTVKLLIENYTSGVTMVTAMKDFFHKFGSRLGEIEKNRKDKLKITRIPITKKNRFGHSCTFTRYKSNAPIRYLENLYNKLNSQGMKKQTV